MKTEQNNTDFLFAEFASVSSKEWKQLIQMELKGTDYNETLVWETLEGIKIKPFYHADEMEYLKIPNVQSEFQIAQTIFIDNEGIANKIALDAIEKGAESIIFIAPSGFDADVLLQNFETTHVKKVVFQMNYLAPHFISSLRASFPSIPIELQIDPIGHLLVTGNWFINEKQDFDQIGSVLDELKKDNVLLIDASLYQNAGANLVQQIAYALAHGQEYLNRYGNRISGDISFNFGIGSHYFFEIAKLRAFRYLWQQLTAVHGLKSPAQLFTKPTLRNKTLYDYNVNILRTATENMSAVLGGSQVVSSLPYDAFFKKSNAFSERIARNQLIMLREENNLKEAQQIATGSYYIEQITLELAKKALELLKDIDKSGGILKQIKAGTIQKKIVESAEKEQHLFDEGKLVLLGTNKFVNLKDHMKSETELFPFFKKRNEKTEVVPLVLKRLSEKMEMERMGEE